MRGERSVLGGEKSAYGEKRRAAQTRNNCSTDIAVDSIAITPRMGSLWIAVTFQAEAGIPESAFLLCLKARWTSVICRVVNTCSRRSWVALQAIAG